MKTFPLRKLVGLAAAIGCALVASTPSSAQTNFAILANDGAWTWYNDPRALFHNGRLYFGYVRAADSKTVLSVFDLSTGTKTDLWTSGFTQLDDHNVPGLLPKQDGTMLAIYARHGSDQYFAWRLCHSTNAALPSSWGPEQLIPNTGASMTYANPYQLSAENGRIYDFCRNLNYNPTVFVSTNGGTNWSSPQLLIQTGTGGSIRPYVKYDSDRTQRIDFLYTDGHPRDVANSLYHLYYQGGKFYKTDGTFVKDYSALPILHDSGERGSVIYQYSDAPTPDPNDHIPTGRAWCWEIGHGADGRPVCVFTVQRDNVTGPINGIDDRIYYYYARWTGSAWQKRFIAQAGRPLYPAEDDYAGGICLDPQDPNTIYLSSNAQNPFELTDTTNVPLRANERYELWRGITSDAGLTFSWTQITSNSAVDNLRPYVPRRNGGEPCVIWFRGTYTSYTSFSCSIVGWFTSPIPPPAFASGTWILDGDGTWSAASNWLDGVIADGPGNVADFNSLDIGSDRTVTLDAPRTIGTLRFGDISGAQNWRVESPAGHALTLDGGVPQIVVNQNCATLAVELAGTNGFTKTGPGTVVLVSSNAISGTLNLDSGSTSANDGAVRLADPGAAARIASPVVGRNNTGGAAASTLELDGALGDLTVTQQLRVSCRNHTIPIVRNLAGSNTLSGGVSYFEGGSRNTFESDAGMLAMTGPMQFQPSGNFTAGRTNIFFGTGDFYVSGGILAATNGAPIHLLKLGEGALILAGANSYTGGTIVNEGTLCVNGSVAAGPVEVAGRLTGTGTIGGPVSVPASGTVSPGAPFGALRINNSLTNDGTLLLTLGKSGLVLTNSSITGLTAIRYGGTLRLVLNGETPASGDSFKLFAAATYAGAFSRLEPAAPGVGLVWNTNGLTNGVLSVRAAARPQIGAISISPTDALISGTNGEPGGTYYVLSSTNLALPLAGWDRLLTNSFDPSGRFAFSVPLAPAVPVEFFALQLP